MLRKTLHNKTTLIAFKTTMIVKLIMIELMTTNNVGRNSFTDKIQSLIRLKHEHLRVHSSTPMRITHNLGSEARNKRDMRNCGNIKDLL